MARTFGHGFAPGSLDPVAPTAGRPPQPVTTGADLARWCRACWPGDPLPPSWAWADQGGPFTADAHARALADVRRRYPRLPSLWLLLPDEALRHTAPEAVAAQLAHARRRLAWTYAGVAWTLRVTDDPARVLRRYTFEPVWPPAWADEWLPGPVVRTDWLPDVGAHPLQLAPDDARAEAARTRRLPAPPGDDAADQAAPGTPREHVAAFLDFARRGDERSFRALAGCLGIEDAGALWTGTVARLRPRAPA